MIEWNFYPSTLLFVKWFFFKELLFILKSELFEIRILIRTVIHYVLKWSFNQPNIPLLLHCFRLFFIYQTTGKLIQVIDISFIIYSSSLVLWSFSLFDKKISSKFFVQALFYLLLTYVYHIYRISNHWYWNLYLVAIATCQWDVSKPDIRICFPHRLVKGRSEGAVFCCCTCHNQYIDWFQGISSNYSSLKFCR